MFRSDELQGLWSLFGDRSAWVKLHEGTIKVTLIERGTLNRDLKKLRGLVMGMFEGRVSRQGRSRGETCQIIGEGPRKECEGTQAIMKDSQQDMGPEGKGPFWLAC